MKIIKLHYCLLRKILACASKPAFVKSGHIYIYNIYTHIYNIYTHIYIYLLPPAEHTASTIDYLPPHL